MAIDYRMYEQQGIRERESMKRLTVFLFAVIAAGAVAASPALAQSMRAELSSSEAELGEVLDLYVTLVNPSQASAPAPPETNDFEIRLVSVVPSQNSRMTIIGDKVSQEQSYTYRYTVRPLREGNLLLPQFTYQEKGRTLVTRPLRVTVGKSSAGPFVICEIESDHEVAYIGQPINLRLKIYIRKFMQAGYGTLDANTTWSLRDKNSTSWGIFSDVNQVPSVQQVRRPDDDGVEREFYVYTLELTAYPTKAGSFDFGDIEFVYQYPVLLARTMLGYQLERARRISARPIAPNLTVQPIPTEGRPPEYNGAVGVYAIFTTAKPTEIPVGDPITLSLSIRGSGSLERLMPPRLDQVEALKKDFEIAADIPAGRVEGDRKVFNVTIRPLREDVRQIPAIPLSYFNPRSQRFETATSRPIPIKVLPAIRLALPASPDAGPAIGAGALTPLVETTGGLFPNYTDPTMVLADQTSEIGPATWCLLAALPLIYLVTCLVQARSARFRNNEALRRRSQAFAIARNALSGAVATRPGQVRAALLGYIADCCNVPAGGLTRAEAVRLASAGGLPPDFAARLDALVEQLEFAEYGGGAAAGDVAEASAQALELIAEMEKRGFR